MMDNNPEEADTEENQVYARIPFQDDYDWSQHEDDACDDSNFETSCYSEEDNNDNNDALISLANKALHILELDYETTLSAATRHSTLQGVDPSLALEFSSGFVEGDHRHHHTDISVIDIHNNEKQEIPQQPHQHDWKIDADTIRRIMKKFPTKQTVPDSTKEGEDI